MGYKEPHQFSRREVFLKALRYSVPVLLGYVTLGAAFSLVVSSTGYPWWLALLMSAWIYAGAGQFIALGLFASGTSLWQACLILFVVNIRHAAYSLSMLKRFRGAGALKPYLVFALTDETFAILSSLPDIAPGDQDEEKKRHLFMLYVSALDQSYWLLGTIIGAVAGAVIPFEFKGVSFALTALFVVLMIEQVKKAKKPGVFVVSAAAALFCVFLLPASLSILAALALAFILVTILKRAGGNKA